jgi:ribonucleotide reductase alpha subunit
VPDDLHGIYGAIQDNAMLSKFAGGLGNDWTPVRALGAYIKGTNGKSQGVVPFLKVVNDTAVAVNQGGKRKGRRLCLPRNRGTWISRSSSNFAKTRVMTVVARTI